MAWRQVTHLARLIDDLMDVALTGWGHEEDRRRLKEAGIDHIVKPVDPEDLMRSPSEG